MFQFFNEQLSHSSYQLIDDIFLCLHYKSSLLVIKLLKICLKEKREPLTANRAIVALPSFRRLALIFLLWSIAALSDSVAVDSITFETRVASYM